MLAAGEWLRSQRERCGISAGEFAAAIGVNRGQISNYELGKNAVDDDRAAQIAVVLRMSLLEVRRGLGLWVPDEPDTAPAPLDPVVAEMQAQIEEIQASRLSKRAKQALVKQWYDDVEHVRERARQTKALLEDQDNPTNG